MNPRLRKLFRTLLKALAVLTVLLLVGTLCLWGLRARIATALAKDYLRNLGIADPQLVVTDLQTDSLTVESIEISSDGAAFAASRLQVSYSLSELLESHRIEHALIEGAALTIELASRANKSATDEPVPPSIPELAALLDLSALQPLSFRRIQISDSKVTLKSEATSTPLSFAATATASSPDTLELEALIAQAEDTLLLQATVSSPAQSRATAALHLASPIALLDRYLPDWSNAFAALKERSSGPLDLHASLVPQDETPAALDVSLQLQDLAFDYEEISAMIPQLSATSSLSDFSELAGRLSFAPQKLLRDTLAVTPGHTIELDLNVRDLSVIEIQTQAPLAWTYDTDTLAAQSEFQLSYDARNPESPLQAQVSNPRFRANGFDLAPFRATVSGTTSQLAFDTSPLELSRASPAALRDGQGSILIPDASDAPITVAFAGKLQPAPLPWNGAAAVLPLADLSLETQVFDAYTETKLTLSAFPDGALVALPEVATLQGGFKLALALRQAADSERLSGKASLDASNLSIQSKYASGDGISLQSQVSFQDLDTTLVSELDLSNEPVLSEILRHTQSSLDWQANELSTPDFDAQWSGGSLSLRPDANGFLLTASFGAGILKLEQFRLDQVYLESEHRGTLSKLEGGSQLSAMLDGAAVELVSQQEVETPLSDLSLSGEYTLSPLVFAHSDLPARFAPVLAGLSFSADVRANGRFHSGSDGADATLSLQLRDGSIAYPASQVNARGLELDLELASLSRLDSGDRPSELRIENIEAGDLRSIQAESRFQIRDGKTLAVDSATVSLFGGQAHLRSTPIPLDGSDFQGTLELATFDLGQIASYIDIFDGQMQGEVSGYLPFQRKEGRFELLRGALRLPNGSPAALKYQTAGLLTEDRDPNAKATFSERLLKFLKVDPDRAAEQALGDITITTFEAELFPEDAPSTPIRIRFEGTAHSEIGDIPVVVFTEVHGSLSELYNFLIRLNSL